MISCTLSCPTLDATAQLAQLGNTVDYVEVNHNCLLVFREGVGWMVLQEEKENQDLRYELTVVTYMGYLPSVRSRWLYICQVRFLPFYVQCDPAVTNIMKNNIESPAELQ